MNKQLAIVLSLCIGLFLPPASAQMYKGVDAEGNVIFSDKPFDNAERYTPPHITVMDAPKVPVKKEAPAEEESGDEVTTYTALRIISPKNQQTIWNEPDLRVQVRSQPPLDVKAGHRYWLFMDGKPLVRNSQRPQLPIGRADRGEHKLQVQIRDQKRRILKRSPTITVHIKHTVVPRKSPR